jgi:uncharacterized protein YndB with AHSA1/START domain
MLITRIRNTFIGIAVFILLIFLVSLAFDHSYVVKKEVRIDAPPGQVFPYINTPSLWHLWMNMSVPDTTYSYVKDGPDEGKNAAVIMKGPLVNIAFRIIRSEPNKAIRYEVSTADGEFHTSGDILLDTLHMGTVVSWVDSGDVGYNSFARFFLKEKIRKEEEDIGASLLRLKKLAEKR